MNIRTLIDYTVRQTVVLIAQLATSGGLRAPLAHVAEQVFLELAQELERQGVSRKVSADMFGMALRTYQRRTQRIAQSQTERGRSLWEAVYDYVRLGDIISREEILHRFRYDDEASVKGVLRDLITSGLLSSTGSGLNTVYRLSTCEEQSKVRQAKDGELEPFLWSIVYREGPIGMRALCEACRLSSEELQPVLDALIRIGRIEKVDHGGETMYRSLELVLGFEDPAGWEASLLDHYTAVVKTMIAKLRYAQSSSAADEVGGSTYHFTLFREHPFQEEVLGELWRFRERFSALRQRIDHYNAEHGLGSNPFQVIAYYGQYIEKEDHDAGLR